MSSGKDPLTQMLLSAFTLGIVVVVVVVLMKRFSLLPCMTGLLQRCLFADKDSKSLPSLSMATGEAVASAALIPLIRSLPRPPRSQVGGG